jgi:hypothetical protein
MKSKLDNKNVEACRPIKMSISNNIRFHLHGIEKPNIAWKKLETDFGKHNEIQANQLKNQLISLNPNYLSCIEDYLSNLKTPRLLHENVR